jgi:hypothetical protein
MYTSSGGYALAGGPSTAVACIGMYPRRGLLPTSGSLARCAGGGRCLVRTTRGNPRPRPNATDSVGRLPPTLDTRARLVLSTYVRLTPGRGT